MLLVDHIIERLEQIGLRHVFGVPGDYILPTVERICRSKKLQFVNTTDEAHAGFAADAYARVRGAGCVVVTYNVGALKLCNAVAGAFAERSPLIVLSGAPGIRERSEEYVLHHVVKGYECQRDIFSNITCASVILDDPTKAGYDLDRALAMMDLKKQPIYIELPRDMAEKSIRYDLHHSGEMLAPTSDQHNLDEALDEVISWLGVAKKPVILAGVQIDRYRLGKQLLKFAERCGIPVATTMLSKSTVNERHPLFLGTYAGSTSQDYVRHYVENSDCLLIFGEVLSDMTVGFRPARFNRRLTVTCSVEGLKVKNHAYRDVHFKDFCERLFKVEVPRTEQPNIPARPVVPVWKPVLDTKISTVRFFEKVNSILDENKTVVADPGDCLFGAVDIMTCHDAGTFLGPAFYNSMGFAIPAGLGLMLANPEKRPIILVGDGAFQMSSCTELSTMADRKPAPIVFVLNNDGYTTERYIRDGSFNDIRPWNYEKMTDVIGGGVGVKVTTEQELEEAVTAALASDKMYLINVVVGRKDISPALKRMTEGLATKV